MVAVLLCGSGSGAHVLAGLGSCQPDTEVRVLALRADKAERWTKAMEGHDFSVYVNNPGQEPYIKTAKPFMVSGRSSGV